MPTKRTITTPAGKKRLAVRAAEKKFRTKMAQGDKQETYLHRRSKQGRKISPQTAEAASNVKPKAMAELKAVYKRYGVKNGLYTGGRWPRKKPVRTKKATPKKRTRRSV